MRAASHRWLLIGVLLAGIGLSGMAAVSARTFLTRSDAITCSNQSRSSRSSERIAACSTMIQSGRLRGEPLGVAYALRGLAYLDRGDTPAAIGDFNRAIALAPDFVPAYQNRGNAWYARGNFGEALDDYDTAIKLDPKAASAYVNRATVRRDLGVIDGALQDYATAIALGAKAPAYASRGQLYMRQQNYAAAIADFDRAVHDEPDYRDYMLRAGAYEADGGFDKALADYQRAARLAAREVPQSAPAYATPGDDPNAVPPPPSTKAINTKLITALTAEAGVWRKKQDYDKAIAVYNKALIADRNRASTYALRAQTYMAMGDDKRALSDIGRALKFSWRANFLKTRGTLRLKTGDIAGAVHDANAILKLNAGNNAAYVLRGAALVEKRQYAEALPDLDRAIRNDDKNVLALSARGQAYFARHEDDKALADFNRAIRLGSKDASICRARAQIHELKGDTDAALADLTAAIHYGGTASDFFQRAALYKTKGDNDQALRNLDAGLKRAPRDIAGLRARATVHLAKNDVGAALKDYNAILKLHPSDLSARFARATIEEQSKDFDKAIADYQAVLKNDSRFKDARVALDRTLAAQRQAQAETTAETDRVARAKAAELAADRAARTAAAKAAAAKAARQAAAAPAVAGEMTPAAGAVTASAEAHAAPADRDTKQPAETLQTADAGPASAAGAPPSSRPSRTASENSGDIVATPLPRARPRAPLVRDARQTPASEIIAPTPEASLTPEPAHVVPLPPPREQTAVRRGDDAPHAVQARRDTQPELRPPNRRAYRRPPPRARGEQAELARQFHAAERARRYWVDRDGTRYYRAGAYVVRRTPYGYVVQRRGSFDDLFR